MKSLVRFLKWNKVLKTSEGVGRGPLTFSQLKQFQAKISRFDLLFEINIKRFETSNFNIVE